MDMRMTVASSLNSDCTALQHAPWRALVSISGFTFGAPTLDEPVLLWDSLEPISVSPHYT
jgi:hypothetical protein